MWQKKSMFRIVVDVIDFVGYIVRDHQDPWLNRRWRKISSNCWCYWFRWLPIGQLTSSYWISSYCCWVSASPCSNSTSCWQDDGDLENLNGLWPKTKPLIYFDLCLKFFLTNFHLSHCHTPSATGLYWSSNIFSHEWKKNKKK